MMFAVLTQGERQAFGEARKTTTIVFSDVSGSTSLSERLDPEALAV